MYDAIVKTHNTEPSASHKHLASPTALRLAQTWNSSSRLISE